MYVTRSTCRDVSAWRRTTRRTPRPTTTLTESLRHVLFLQPLTDGQLAQLVERGQRHLLHKYCTMARLHYPSAVGSMQLAYATII